MEGVAQGVILSIHWGGVEDIGVGKVDLPGPLFGVWLGLEDTQVGRSRQGSHTFTRTAQTNRVLECKP